MCILLDLRVRLYIAISRFCQIVTFLTCQTTSLGSSVLIESEMRVPMNWIQLL
jgi:hypothetical protein